MAELHITCTVSDGSDEDYRLEGVGGGQTLLTSWYHTIDTAIRNIECRTHRYYTSHCGRTTAVIVKVHPVTGRKYLTTEADGYSGNNLSKLKTCRIAA